MSSPINENENEKESLRKYLVQHYRSSTVRDYQQTIEMYLDNYPQAAFANYQQVVGYIGLLRQRYRNSGTLSRVVSGIKVYYQYLCEQGLRQDNPALAIRLLGNRGKDIQLQDLLSREQLEGLLYRKERYKDHDHRHRVMMGLLVYQALLPSEIAALLLTDINLVAGSIYVRQTGITNSRELPLQSAQVLVLHSYLTEVRIRLLHGADNDRLLVRQGGQSMSPIEIGQQVLRSYKDRYAGKKVNTRMIRQSVIKGLLEQGHDISVVQLFAGHKLPEATQRYKSDGVDSLRSALDKYHPFNPINQLF